jgi:hypothetical protein
MDLGNITPMLSEEQLSRQLNGVGDLPLVELFESRTPNWSADHETVLEEMGGAPNGSRVFKTLVGHPQRVGFTSVNQCEAQVVEFVRYYGRKSGLERPTLERVATDLIRATPIAALKSRVWSDPERAERRVAELYEFISERRQGSDGSGTGDDGRSRPQDLSGTRIPSGVRVTERERELRRDLLGK